MAKNTLVGVAWDHRRCWGPLEADAEAWASNRGVSVRWNRRSLFSFGEGDLGEFVDAHDIIVFDHPFTGDVSRRNLLLDLRQFLSADDIKMLENNQVGASYLSYHYEGGIFGLPIDTAAITSAWRPDLMAESGYDTPGTLEEVYSLAKRARDNDRWIAWAAKPTDLFCTYMAMLAGMGVNVGQEKGPFSPREVSGHVIELMKKLRDLVHPDSFNWNPIRLFDHMVANDDIVYAPFAFNYINYSSLPERRLAFGSSPRISCDLPARGLLGGAGIGISTRCQNPEAAFRYAIHLVDPDFQASDYITHGGQPGIRTAWVSEQCDQMTNGFFSGCLQAMDNAFLRPTLPGFVSLFHEGTGRLAAVVMENASHPEFWDWLTKSYDSLRSGGGTELSGNNPGASRI